MSAPSCYVVSAAEMSALIDACAYLALVPLVLTVVFFVDWWWVVDRFRVWRRLRRIRQGRAVR